MNTITINISDMEINALLKNIANAIANAKDNNIGLFTGMSGFALYELSYGIYFKNEYFLLKGMQKVFVLE